MTAATVTCPACGRLVEPVPVVYGHPTLETFERAEHGEVRLGGCMPPSDDLPFRLPTSYCPACDEPISEAGGRG